jgi:hypothetical protein
MQMTIHIKRRGSKRRWVGCSLVGCGGGEIFENDATQKRRGAATCQVELVEPVLQSHFNPE